MYIVFEINLRPNNLDSKFKSLNYLFGVAKLSKIAVPDKYCYSGYGIGFDVRGIFSLSDGSEFGKNAIIFGVDNSPSLHANHSRKYILILCKGISDGLNNTTITAEVECSINFSEQQHKFHLRLHYNRSNSYLFVNKVNNALI